MTQYSTAALGQVVRRLRREKGLTQEALGTGAGYRAGAGVSISRLENGRLEPTVERLVGIARELGVSTDELEDRALQETLIRERGGADVYEERISRLVRASAQRQQLAPALGAFTEARSRAERDFLMSFRGVATRVRGIPDSEDHDQDHLVQLAEAERNAIAAQAAYQIQFTQYGVSRALADADAAEIVAAGAAGVAGVALGAMAALAFTEDVALKTAPLGASVPALRSAGAALKGLRAAMGVGRPANRFGGTAGGTNLLAILAVGALVAGLVDRQEAARRNRKQRESAEKLATAEAEVASNQPNVEALLDLVPKATEVLDYVAVHAGHALTRWAAKIGDDAVSWQTLSGDEQQRYQDFVTIAAAQLAVLTIDFQELGTSRADELDQAKALADEILIQSRRAITSRV